MTKPTKPSPITRADCTALVSLQGERLFGVAYHYLAPVNSTRYAGGEKGVDCDLAAVDLDLGNSGTTALTWAMAGELEGLAILRGESYSGIGIEIMDASGREAWREHLGERITSVAASWQISGEDCPESLWASRINFASGSIVIALGAAPELRYMPDEIVVVFDMSLARSYKPTHVSDSSWGALVETS